MNFAIHHTDDRRAELDCLKRVILETLANHGGKMDDTDLSLAVGGAYRRVGMNRDLRDEELALAELVRERRVVMIAEDELSHWVKLAPVKAAPVEGTAMLWEG